MNESDISLTQSQLFTSFDDASIPLSGAANTGFFQSQVGANHAPVVDFDQQHSTQINQNVTQSSSNKLHIEMPLNDNNIETNKIAVASPGVLSLPIHKQTSYLAANQSTSLMIHHAKVPRHHKSVTSLQNRANSNAVLQSSKYINQNFNILANSNPKTLPSTVEIEDSMILFRVDDDESKVE
jgi:hypothetical protein